MTEINKKRWSDQMAEKIDDNANQYLSIRDYRFYQIEKLKRIALLIERQNDCSFCENLKQELEQIVDEMNRLINQSGTNRSEYENRMEALVQHLKREHQVYQMYHFTYRYSTYAVLISIAVGVLLSFIVFQQLNGTLFLVCVGLGILIGNILGAKKDNICKKEKRQL